jgi:uncharacterized protein (TIGR03000 family)
VAPKPASKKTEEEADTEETPSNGTLPPPDKKETESSRRRARLYVKAPLDVKVRIGGKLATRTRTEQVFSSPVLQRGQKYTYVVAAEAVRGGQPVTRTQRVTVQAGKMTRIDFTNLQAPAKGTTAHITVLLPADAQLYVDGVACPLTSEKRTFETPELQAGRDYFYTLRAEVVRNGATLTETKRIDLRAGAEVTVRLNDLTARAQAALR